MRSDLTKSQRRRIRELAATAYDRELSRELGSVEEEFGRWRRAEIDAYELTQRIHRFHQGPNRSLHSIYTSSDLEMVVGAAIAKGILTEQEAGPEIVRLLENWIDFTRRSLAPTGDNDADGADELERDSSR